MWSAWLIVTCVLVYMPSLGDSQIQRRWILFDLLPLLCVVRDRKPAEHSWTEVWPGPYVACQRKGKEKQYIFIKHCPKQKCTTLYLFTFTWLQKCNYYFCEKKMTFIFEISVRSKIVCFSFLHHFLAILKHYA